MTKIIEINNENDLEIKKIKEKNVSENFRICNQ